MAATWGNQFQLPFGHTIKLGSPSFNGGGSCLLCSELSEKLKLITSTITIHAAHNNYYDLQIIL